MRFLYAKFVGYIGFYNGMGLSELEIDFSKCNHKMIIISGKNGSGKSTLLNSLNILPDNSSSYVDGMNASKEIHLIDNDIIYMIKIISPISNNGRGTTKAYLCKNGIELNPNGNISSYKDIVFEEFELDPNYIALSHLSMDDKGIVQKKPGERKKFFSSILSSVDAYNSMNKIFSKKANIFKSYINNTSSKIKSLGDSVTINGTLYNISNRLKDNNNRRIQYEKELAEAESYIKIVDPDGSIQERYNIIYSNMTECNDSLKKINEEFESKRSIVSYDNLEKARDNLLSNITSLEYSNESNENKLKELIDSKEEDLHILEIKKQKIDNIKTEFDVDQMRDTVQTLEKSIKIQESIFKSSGITNFGISKEEFLYIFSKLNEIKSLVNVYRDRDFKVIQDTCKIIRDNGIKETEDKLINTKIKIESINNSLSNVDSKLQSLYMNTSNMESILKDRPKECSIDTCPLIKNAVDLQKSNPSKQIELLEIEKEEYIEEKNNLIKDQNYLEELVKSIRDLCGIISIIDSNTLLDRLPISYILRSREEFLNRISNGNTFDEIEVSRDYIEQAEEIESYKDNKELLIKFQAELKINENKESLIEDLMNEVLSIESKITNIEETSTNLTKSIIFNKKVIEDNRILLDRVNELIELECKRDEIKTKKEKLLEEYRSIKSNLEQIKIYVDKINLINNELDTIYTENGPLEEQKKILEHSLISLEEYKSEYNLYSEKYNIVNKLKKYSSPADEGIQTLFIDVYMSKTLSLCNELLSMLFRGQYSLMKYKINADEFKMPFIGEGLPVDDISNGSSSQVAMMGMIVNFVLLFQASTKFNIVRCDELDEALDTYNRLQYIEVLYRVMDILNIEQCIIISHSTELNRENMDVIQLSEYSETDCYNQGNIIYNFYDHIKR